jgi:hypothetical protein
MYRPILVESIGPSREKAGFAGFGAGRSDPWTSSGPAALSGAWASTGPDARPLEVTKKRSSEAKISGFWRTLDRRKAITGFVLPSRKGHPQCPKRTYDLRD